MGQATRDAGIAGAQPFKRIALTDNLERVAAALASHYTPIQPALLYAVTMEDERVQEVSDESRREISHGHQYS